MGSLPSGSPLVYHWQVSKAGGLSGRSYTGEMVLCLGLVDNGRIHRRYMEPRLFLFLRTLYHGHTLVTDNHINTHIQHPTY